MTKFFLIHRFPVIIIFTAVSLIYCLPIMLQPANWGGRDWDQFTFWNAVSREEILKYHQVPLWNPFGNGGNVLLAHPHSSFLSPFFILVLLFGVIIGLKFQIILHLIIGLLGMFYLARQFRLTIASSCLSAFILMLSSIYPLHVTEGHAEWFTMAFLPWLFWSHLKSYGERKYILAAAFFLSLIILGGSVDVLTIVVPLITVYTLCVSLQKKDALLLRNLFFVFITATLLSCVKLLPMIEFLSFQPRLSGVNVGHSIAFLPRILLGRAQSYFYSLSSDASGIFTLDKKWHEYGAYIGIFPLILFIAGAITGFKKYWPLIITGLFSLFVSFGVKSPVNLWKIIHSLPFYDSITCPSRFILGFIFSLSLIAGISFSKFENFIKSGNLRRIKIIVPASVFLVFCDLLLVGSPILKQAFVIKPLEVIRQADFRQRYRGINFYNSDISRSSMYPIFLSNSGILDSYEVVRVKRGDVATVNDHNYKGEVYLEKGNGRLSIVNFSPNKIEIKLNLLKADNLIINQNFYTGWKARKGKIVVPALSRNGLIYLPLFPEDKTISLFYRPESFLVGMFISLLSSFYLLSMVLRKERKFNDKLAKN